MIEYQRLILADRVRNGEFEKALRAAVTPGCTVVDVGSGTGFLAFLALKLGAGKAILIEREPEFLQLSKEIAKENSIKNCQFILASSNEVRETFNADVLISETLGNFAYEENIIETMRDARRFLKPGGVLIPNAIKQSVAPVIADRLWKEVAAWNDVGFGLKLSPGLSRSVNNMYVKTVSPKELLPMKQWDSIDLKRGDTKSVRSGEVQWTATKAETIYGLCLSWECTLHKDIVLSTSPAEPLTHWQQIYLPVAKPVALKAGDALHCTIFSDSRPSVKINVAWTITHLRAGKILETQKHDMRDGR